MQYRIVPKSGDKLSVLGFGAMRFPTNLGRIDEKKAITLLRSAIDQGVNYIDTAVPYHGGASEPLVGKALRDGYRERVSIATKLPPWTIFSRDDMDTVLSEQLSKLETTVIDYYLLHSLEATNWKKLSDLNVLSFLNDAKHSGKIKNAGFSFHGDIVTFKKIIDAYDWDFCQIQLNILDEQFQAGLEGLKYAASRDIAVFIMEPLRGGMLVKAPNAVQDAYAKVHPAWTPVEWALRYLWNYPEVTLLLSGMNEESQIVENVKVAEKALPNSLSDEEKEAIKEVQSIYHKEIKIGCTGCGYCMPCPFGVNIQQCFSFYNQKYMYKRSQFPMYLMMLQGLFGPESRAGICRKCGACVPKCPQHLQIPKLLSDVEKEFEGPLKQHVIVPIVKRCYGLYAKMKRK
jgi:predicted aldo/keto reductase-like oxidoreductase